MAWACFQTYGSQERKAITNLARQGLESFTPFYLKHIVNPLARLRRQKPRQLALFPCYGFVRLDDPSQWGVPGNTYGVVRLLTDRNKTKPRPLWVPDAYIESLGQVTGPALVPLFPQNAIVRVREKSSPFYQFTGQVVSMDKHDRFKLLMSLFNRDVVVEFDYSDLEAI